MNVRDGIHFLTNDCLNYAFDHKISFFKWPFPNRYDPSFARVDKRMIFINRNYYLYRQIPFQVCHEVSHILNHDDYRLRNFGDYNSISISAEYNADQRALHILLPLYFNYISYYANNSVMPIMRTLCIPPYLIDDVVNIVEPMIRLIMV